MSSFLKGKIIIKTNLTVLTGLHIGGSDTYSAIGTVDAPVIKSPLNGKPIVPGSSLKGKLRTLIASVTDTSENFKKNEDTEAIQKLFGTSTPKLKAARLQFSDAYITDVKTKLNALTEVKFENTINRGTCKANPRQIERVVAGTVFDVVIVYNIEELDEIIPDMQLLALGLKLLQYDYLGGHGSRGSGRVSFNNFSFKPIENDEIDTEKLKEVFKEVEEYELLRIQN